MGIVFSLFDSLLRLFGSQRQTADRPSHSPETSANQAESTLDRNKEDYFAAHSEQTERIRQVQALAESGDEESIKQALEEIDDLNSRLPLREKLVREAQENLRKRDAVIAEYPRPDNLANHNINVGISGGTGVGKSSFVNALFGKKVAKTSSIGECTQAPTDYTFEGFKWRQVVLWDMPGAGTESHEGKSYVKEKGLLYFDIVVFLCDHRFREADSAVMEVLHEHDIPFMTVRTKTCEAVKNEQEENPGKTEQQILDEIRKALSEKTKTTSWVHCVDSKEPSKYDFPTFMFDMFAAVLVRRSVSHGDDDDKKCSICLEAYHDDSNGCLVPVPFTTGRLSTCGHQYCEKCLRSLRSCPQCRASR